MAEQSKVPEKMNATVVYSLTQVSGLGVDGLFMAMQEPFVKARERVFVQKEQVVAPALGKECTFLIVYRRDGMRQAFGAAILDGSIEMDEGLSPVLAESPEAVVTEQTLHSIGWALQEMREGYRVRRRGWYGRGMWLALQVPDPKSKMTLPYIYMCTAQGELVPWLCSQTDLLAEDYERAE